MRLKSILGTVIILLLFPIMLFAYNAQTARTAFLAALSDLQHRNQAGFVAITQNLKDYPLYPYLIYSDLIMRLDTAQPDELKNFLEANKNTPLEDHLRHAWLTQLAARHQWPLFLAIYQPTKNVSLQCSEREALWQTGDTQGALLNFDELLNKNNTVPDSCLLVLAQALHQGNLAQNLLWSRISSAFENHNPDLAIQLGDLLSQKDKENFKLWLKIYDKPGLILKLNNLPGPLLVTGIQRLSEQNAHDAAVSWNSIVLSNKNRIDLDTQQKAVKIIGLNLARVHDSSAGLWLWNILPKYADNTVREWRIREALYQQNWPMVQAAINNLPPEEKKLPQWRYWLARALSTQNQLSAAQNIYRDLSLHGDYYGQLASVQLNQIPLNSVANLKVNSAQITAISSLPGIQRSYELYQLKWLPEATQEWQWVIKHIPEEDYLAAAELAIQWGWFERAIDTVNLISSGSNIALRFPLAYKDSILDVSLKNNLDPAWVFALIRQESLFMPEAKSSAGALGLMQLMPNTAYIVASQLHMSFMTRDLLNPQTNVELGSAYLKNMLAGFNNNMILATAAYNAGPGNVKKWLPNKIMPADVWVETIPFLETRGYVKNIMSAMTFYEKELTLPITLSNRFQKTMSIGQS